jgi:hypothetical protein
MKTLLSWVVCVASFGTFAQSRAEQFLGGRAGLRGGVFAFYCGDQQAPAALVRMDRAYTDYERKGFFRIGLFPVAVMEGVTFEICQPEAVANSLEQWHQWLGPSAANHMELRRGMFLVTAASTNRLEFTRARLGAQGSLELLDGVTFLFGTNQMRAMQGRLQIGGECAGRLILATKPPWTNSLSGHITTAKPSNQEKTQ